MRAGHPNRAVGFEHALTASQPFGIEFVVQFRSARDVPVAFIHFDHFTRVTGDAAVREKVWRVGKDGVEPALGIFGGDGVQQIQTVSMIQPHFVCIIVINQFGQGRGTRDESRGWSAGFQHGVWDLFGTCRAGGRRSNRAVFAQGEVSGWLEFKLQFVGFLLPGLGQAKA